MSRHETARRRLAGEEPAAAARTASDERGRFELAAAGPGMWQVSIAAEGFVPVRMPLSPLLESTVLRDAELEPDAGLAVRVVGGDGRPLTAQVAAHWPGPAPAVTGGMRLDELFPGRWQPDVRRAVTGEDGRARLPRRARETLRIEVAAGTSMAALETGDGGAVEVVLGGRERRLRVTDARGRPVPGLLIATPDGDLPLAVTDREGSASLMLAEGAEVELAFLGAAGEIWTETLPARPVVAVVLDDPVVLQGRVFDARDRRPVGGAWVWMAGDSGGFVESDGGGGFSFAAVDAAGSLLFAAAPGYCRGMAAIPAGRGGETAVAVAVASAAGLGGVVVDGRGEPLAGVAVSASLDSSSASPAAQAASFGGWHSRTSDRGRFRLSGLPAGERFELELSRSGYATATVDVADLASRDDLRVVLREGLRGAGVLVTVDGEPIAGGEVRLRSAESDAYDFSPEMLLSGAPRRHVVPTDEAGRFEIPDLTPGRYDLEAEAAGFAPVTVPGLEIAGEDGDEVDLGTLVMVPGLAVEGRVADRHGQPIAGAEVRVAGPDPALVMLELLAGDRPADAVSDAAGSFRVNDQRLGDVVALTVRKPGYAGKYLVNVEVVDPPDPLVVELEELGRVRGRVTAAGGSPVADAEVRFEPTAVAGDGTYSIDDGTGKPVLSDAAGRFELGGLAAGTGEIRVTADGFQRYQRSGLSVPAGGELAGVEVVLERGVAAEGRVVGPGGEPVTEAWIRFSEPGDDTGLHGMCTTDADGRFFVDGLPTGLKTVTAHHRGHQPVSKEVELTTGRNFVEIELGGGVEVSGRVVDGAGQPLADAVVRLRRSPALADHPLVDTRADGSFVVEAVPPGDYVVLAFKDGYYQPPEGEPLLVESAPVAGLEVRLAAGTTLRGRILGAELDDLARIEVYARREGARRNGQVSHDGYRIAGLPPGDWSVRALIPQAGKQARGEVSVAEGMVEAELDIEFRRGFVIDGLVVHRGAAVRGATVWLQALDAQDGMQGTTGGEGGFRFESLDSGRYRVFVHGPAGTVPYREAFELDSDRELLVELETATALAGVALDAATLEPLAEVDVHLASRPGIEEREIEDSARSDSRGVFRLEKVPGGPWKLTASRPGYAPATLSGEARIGEPVDDLELRLRPTAGISFEVFHPDGRPASRVHAAVLDASGARITGGVFATTDGGRVRMTTVPEGAWELLVQAGDSAVVRRRIVAPGAAGRIDVEAGGALDLSVPALEGEAEARIDLLGPEGTPHVAVLWGGGVQSEWSLHGGRSTVDHLRPGTWSVRVTSADGRGWAATVTVRAGETAEVALD